MISRIPAFIVSTLALAAGIAIAQNQADTPVEQAQKAAETWLAVIDSTHYEASWEQAAPFFKKQVTSEQWAAAMNQGRKVLGDMKSRKIEASQRTTNIPGAGEGEFVLMQFTTSFAEKDEAVETVTMMRDEDAWKAAGYFLR